MKGKLHIILIIMVIISSLTLLSCVKSSQTSSTGQSSATSTVSKPIEIKLATWASQEEPHVKVLQWFSTELENRTSGRVKVNLFLAAALGSTPELPENVQKGIADMAIIVPSHATGLMPVAELMSVPMLIPSASLMHYIGEHLVSEGLLNLKDTKILAVTGHENISLFTTKKKITTLEDLKGLIIGGPGSFNPILSKYGATEVLLPPPEIYTNVERGIVDGGVFGLALVTQFKMEGLLKYVCSNSLGNDAWAVIMNLKTWQNLPSDIQVIMLELSKQVAYKLTMVETEQNQICLDHFAKHPQMEVYSLSSDDYDTLRKLAKPLAQEKAVQIDKQGLPGSAALEIIYSDLKNFGIVND